MAPCPASAHRTCADECAQSGIGRTGKWFGFEHAGVKPDVVTFAKGIGNGMPVGAIWARKDVAAVMSPGDHGSTYSGTAIATAAVNAVINEMTLRVPVAKASEVGVRPPVSADELEDLVAVLSKADPRVPSNWSRRFKNHQEKLKSGDVYQVAEVVRNLAARNRDASLSAAERTMYDRARINLISEIAPALKVSTEEAEAFLDEALAKGVLKPPKVKKAAAAPKAAAKKPKDDEDDF